LNTVKNISEIKQYESPRPSGILERDEVLQKLDDLKKSESLKSYSKLSEVYRKIEDMPDGWEKYAIIPGENGGWRIFHKYINYQKVGNIEERIGIYVI
jgi:hypothetical protein